jgi:hypothetical protein
MSKIAITPNASGTGTINIVAPNTNTDRTLTIPDITGNVVTTGDTGTVTAGMVAGINTSAFPSGTAIQVVNSASGTNYNTTADAGGAATGHALLTNYSVTITPVRTGSRFKVDGKVSSVGFANTTGVGAIYSLVKYSIAGGTVTAAGIDVGHYGSPNTYANHVVSGLTSALSYTLGQSIVFSIYGYGQYCTGGEYAWNRVGGGSGLTITEIAQ